MKNIIQVIYPDEVVFSFVMENTLSPEVNLERVFAEWNHGSGMECEQFVKSKKRSLSVNDIVGVNGKYFQCYPVGWNEVSPEYVNQLEKEVAIHPFRFVHGAWFALSEVMYARQKVQFC